MPWVVEIDGFKRIGFVTSEKNGLKSQTCEFQFEIDKSSYVLCSRLRDAFYDEIRHVLHKHRIETTESDFISFEQPDVNSPAELDDRYNKFREDYPND